MPLVRIDTSNEWSAEQAGQMGETVYTIMHDTLNVPGGDKFQIIQRHPSGVMNIAPSYLGISYSSKVMLIQITLNQGRTTELKQKFYAALADALHAAVGVRKDDVVVNLVEVAKENWSFGGGVAQYAEK